MHAVSVGDHLGRVKQFEAQFQALVSCTGTSAPVSNTSSRRAGEPHRSTPSGPEGQASSGGSTCARGQLLEWQVPHASCR